MTKRHSSWDMGGSSFDRALQDTEDPAPKIVVYVIVITYSNCMNDNGFCGLYGTAECKKTICGKWSVVPVGGEQ